MEIALADRTVGRVLYFKLGYHDPKLESPPIQIATSWGTSIRGGSVWWGTRELIKRNQCSQAARH